ncbi:MAG: thiamine pyrophosphate-dependent enzyme [Planctomycetota bacterium]
METAHLARGLLEGQLHQTMAGLRLVRAAELALDGSGDAVAALARLGELRVDDLTPEERALVPPLVIVGDDHGVGDGALGALVSVLSEDLPVKVVVLSDIGGVADGGLAVDAFGRYPAGARLDLALLAIATRRAFVVQTSFAHEDHFANGVGDAFAHEGPALILVHAPSPQRHGFAAERLHEQAALAVATRAHPLLRYDPAAGGVFGTGLDLQGNPDVASRLASASTDEPLTPVDWAVTEDRYAEQLLPLGDHAAPMPIAEYLALPEAERSGRTPYVVDHRAGDERRRVGALLVRDAEARLQLWQTLQELAGVVTPFTAQVREAAERDLAAAHAEEIERLRAEHEARLADLRREMHAETAQRITDRLLTLAGRGVGDRDDGGNAP